MTSTAGRDSKLVSFRRPQCTHTTMNRVHGIACSACGRVPDHGWVYQCRQDHDGAHGAAAARSVDSSTQSVVDGSDSFEAKARLAEHLKMNCKVIKGIRAGDYSIDQADKLISQKQNVICAITDQEQAQISPIAAAVAVSTTSPRTSYLKATKQLSKDRRDSVAMQSTIAPPACTYTTCAACRPYFADRLWASFETILNDQPQVTAKDMRTLPMVDPAIARTIGLRSAASPDAHAPAPRRSIEITNTDDDSTISANWSASNSTDSDSKRSQTVDRSELFPCPGPLHCPVWSRNSGCAYETGVFYDGKRAENHGYYNGMTPETSRSQLSNYTYLAPSTLEASSTTASSVSLLSTPTMPSVSLLNAESATDEPSAESKKRQAKKEPAHRSGDGASQTADESVHDRKSNGSMGSQVEGVAGVALTH